MAYGWIEILGDAYRHFVNKAFSFDDAAPVRGVQAIRRSGNPNRRGAAPQVRIEHGHGALVRDKAPAFVQEQEQQREHRPAVLGGGLFAPADFIAHQFHQRGRAHRQKKDRQNPRIDHVGNVQTQPAIGKRQ